MSIKHSLAGKKRWANISKEDRSSKMSDLAKIRHSKMSNKEKTAHAMLMVEGKKNKKLLKQNKTK